MNGNSKDKGLNKTYRILVVDDEDLIRTMLREFFIILGHHVDTAECGIDAAQKLEPGKYDFIICDYEMPGMNGLQFLEHVREIDEEVIFYMISGNKNYTMGSIKKGANDFLLKPFNPLNILERMESKSLIVKK